GGDEGDSFPEHQGADLAGTRTEGHADADFSSAAGDRIRGHAAYANAGEQHGEEPQNGIDRGAEFTNAFISSRFDCRVCTSKNSRRLKRSMPWARRGSMPDGSVPGTRGTLPPSKGRMTTLGGVLLYAGLIGAAAGLFSLLKPLRIAGIRSRRRGLIVFGATFLVFAAGGYP